MLKKFVRLFRDEEGISAIEYAIIGGAVLAVVSAGAIAIAPQITTQFDTMNTALGGS
jgi:Flp pilus assembly pilin Flp